MYYTLGGGVLVHSAKGSSWKKHLYTAKKNIGGKISYIYGSWSKKEAQAHKENEKHYEGKREYYNNLLLKYDDKKLMDIERSWQRIHSYAS